MRSRHYLDDSNYLISSSRANPIEKMIKLQNCPKQTPWVPNPNIPDSLIRITMDNELAHNLIKEKYPQYDPTKHAGKHGAQSAAKLKKKGKRMHGAILSYYPDSADRDPSETGYSVVEIIVQRDPISLCLACDFMAETMNTLAGRSAQ
jgi:hypothetical protein